MDSQSQLCNSPTYARATKHLRSLSYASFLQASGQHRAGKQVGLVPYLTQGLLPWHLCPQEPDSVPEDPLAQGGKVMPLTHTWDRRRRHPLAIISRTLLHLILETQRQGAPWSRGALQGQSLTMVRPVNLPGTQPYWGRHGHLPF